jgi:hypothetical protein
MALHYRDEEQLLVWAENGVRALETIANNLDSIDKRLALMQEELITLNETLAADE